MQNKNNHISSIEVTYFTKSIIIEKKLFASNVKFKDIIDHFNLSIKPKNNNLELKDKYNYNLKNIEESTNISDLFDSNTNIKNDILNLYIELIDSNDLNWNMNYILKPKINPFGIISFSTIANTISSDDFQNEMINSNNLDKYHPEFSAYCNSYDSLFISGGIEKNGDPIDDFWIINHSLNKNNNDNIEKYQIKHIKMPSNKKEHSMIYNKEGNSIIIIGGNDKKCLIYNINSETFSELPEMNDVHINPALLIKNNYLYVFDSFNTKKNYFEKLDLSKKGNWEKFFPKSYSSYNNKNFSLCESSEDDKIIILGGERIGHYTILYDVTNNSLLNSKGKDQTSKAKDKTLYRINNNYYANITDTEDNSIIIVNSSTNEVQKANFDNSGKTDFNFNMNEESDISVEPIIKDKKLNKSVNIASFQNSNNENDDKIIFQSYNNNLNNTYLKKLSYEPTIKREI